jgi:MoaA/NifB/PqqE/SkfB family radical SAM enzyme
MPHVYLVFMPMKANLHEVDAFVRLVADLGADRLLLRPLNRSEGADLTWDRGGYRFVYSEEILPFEEMRRRRPRPRGPRSRPRPSRRCRDSRERGTRS